MPFERSLLSSSLLAALVAAAALQTGCRDEAASSAPSAASASAALAASNKAPVAINVDPIITKTYRVQACYFGTLALHQARNAYLGSLNGAEPGPDHIPDFGAAADDNLSGRPSIAPVASATPAGSSKAKALAAPKPAAVPSTKASAAPPAASAAKAPEKTKPSPDANRKIRQVRYEYFARMCKTASGLKSPDSADLDALLADYSTFAMDLAKNIAEANTYYQKEDYKKDSFAKGKQLHGKIVDQFKKLDDYDKKLGDALKDFESKHPIDKSGWTESQKLADAISAAGREVFTDLDQEKVDATKAKDDLAKLDSAIDALKKYGGEHKDAQDPFAQIVAPAGDRMAKEAHQIIDAPDFKSPPPSHMVALTTFFEQVLDGNYRALLKKLRYDAGGGPTGFGPKVPRMPNGHPMLPVQRRPAGPQ